MITIHPGRDADVADPRPVVLFVCVRNSGKSQLAAALLRRIAGDTVRVVSAGTEPGRRLNAESVASLAEIGVEMDGEHPKTATPELIAAADLVVLLGSEVRLETGAVPQRRWEIMEPSRAGFEGMDRMRMIRDEIARHVTELAGELRADGPDCAPYKECL